MGIVLCEYCISLLCPFFLQIMRQTISCQGMFVLFFSKNFFRFSHMQYKHSSSSPLLLLQRVNRKQCPVAQSLLKFERCEMRVCLRFVDNIRMTENLKKETNESGNKENILSNSYVNTDVKCKVRKTRSTCRTWAC